MIPVDDDLISRSETVDTQAAILQLQREWLTRLEMFHEKRPNRNHAMPSIRRATELPTLRRGLWNWPLQDTRHETVVQSAGRDGHLRNSNTLEAPARQPGGRVRSSLP